MFENNNGTKRNECTLRQSNNAISEQRCEETVSNLEDLYNSLSFIGSL